jgi:hypothetical protein
VEEVLTVATNLQAERICVILDNDAQTVAIGLADKFGGKGVAVPCFHEDVKDMDEDDMINLLEVLRGR